MDSPLINAINWANESFIIVYAFILFIVLSLIERFVLNIDNHKLGINVLLPL